MTTYHLQPLICQLLFVLFFGTSCNAQVNTNTPANKVIDSIAAGQPRLIKHHSNNKYQAAADNVHCGLQDKAGNLWFGTTGDGVYRYDGKSFTNFTIKDGLDTNQILSILEDKSGNIWFGSRSGICRFDGKTIAKIPVSTNSHKNYFPGASSYNISPAKNAVWSMMQDKNGTIWFGTDEGLYCYDGKIFTRFLDNSSIINKSGLTLKSVQYMLEDTNGNIWFASGPMAFEGICLYDGKQLTNFKPNDQQWIRKIVASKNGTILFATRSAGVCYYNPSRQDNEQKFDSFSMPLKFINGSLTNMLEDKAGNIWIASDYGNHPGDTLGGLWCSNLPSNDLADKPFTKITNQEVFFMLEDKDNNIWFGTRGTDLYRYDRKTFTKFSE